MMKLSVFLMVGLAALAFSGLPSAAEPVPERAMGIWSTTECGAEGLALLVNSRLALMIDGEGLQARLAVVPVGWAGESLHSEDKRRSG